MKTLKQHIRKLSKEQFLVLKDMCKHSNSLYNSALYVCEKHFEETNKYIGYLQLYHEIKTSIHYKGLPTKIGQQILRLVDKNYRSFFALLKRKAKGQHADKINKPKYKKPGSEFILILPSDQINYRNNQLKITKNLRLPFNFNLNGKIKQAVIKPKGGKYYEILLNYEENTNNKPVNLKSSNYLSVDLGVSNFVSCFSNVSPSFIIGGGSLKSYNQFYNKRKAKIQSELEKCNKKKWSNHLNRININRQNWIDNFFNQTVSLLIKHCLKYEISNLVCGYSKSWKQNSNMGKKNNQNFQSIPFWLFKRKLENKCQEYGINFILQEETYTSKCSFLDNEKICEHKQYKGKRTKRGLFKTSQGNFVNADINAAANILRKAFPKFKLNDGIEGFIVSPLMLKNIFNSKN